jgi:mannose-6-phosphate isomerase-like protein (cupin superfamily)
MKITAALSLAALLTISILAQQPARNPPPAGPPEVTTVTAADLAAIIAKQPSDRNGSQALIKLAPYSVNMEHRVVSQAAAVHEHDAELFYVIDGAGTIVTGGKLVASPSGNSIQGGVSRKISKGDFVLVPEGVPHQIPTVEGNLTVMTLHLPRPAASN